MRGRKQKYLLKVFFVNLGPSFFVHTNLQKTNRTTFNTLSIFAMELYFVLSIKLFVDKGALSCIYLEKWIVNTSKNQSKYR